MNYKLLAMDMDGTLLRDDKTISEQNLLAVRQAVKENIIVMLTTGRGMVNIAPYIEQLQLDTPIVALNGAEVWESPHQVIHRSPLPFPIISSLKQIAIELDTWYWAYTPERLIHKKDWLNDKEEAEATFIKFGFSTTHPHLLQEIDRRLIPFQDQIEITSSNSTNREISLKGVTKASGVQMICQRLGISLQECVSVGDGENDISMLSACGLGIAMSNATEKVKQHADLLTTDNESNGIAKLINYIIKHNHYYQSN